MVQFFDFEFSSAISVLKTSENEKVFLVCVLCIHGNSKIQNKDGHISFGQNR